MMERILSGWTFTRALYMLIGSAIIFQSVMDRQWIGVILGGYFASMGVFAFGCAAGNCFSRVPADKPVSKAEKDIEVTEFSEVNTK